MEDDLRAAGDNRSDGQALVNARQRIGLLAQKVGTNHPEYAVGLNQLALLLIMQGDPEGAEPLLLEALEIRRSTLGETHPDYATNLSSLGGLLWARGDLDQAERYLRNASEIRVSSLGHDHPKTVVSRNSLQQLLEAKAENEPEANVSAGDALTESLPVKKPAPSLTPAATPSPPPDLTSTSSLVHLHAQIASEFAALGDRLLRAARQLRSDDVPPPEELVRASSAARDRFEALRDRVGQLAREYGDDVTVESADSLEGLSGRISALREVESRRREWDTIQSQARSFLDKLERLRFQGASDGSPLAGCKAKAAELRSLLDAGGADVLPDECRLLASGSHAAASLVALVSSDEATSDAQWGEWYDAVESEYGSSLAAAVARGRIVPDVLE